MSFLLDIYVQVDKCQATLISHTQPHPAIPYDRIPSQKSRATPLVADCSIDLDDVLDQTVFAYNTSVHESTCLSPYEMIFGRKARMPIEVELVVPLHNPSTQSQYSPLIRKAFQKANEIARNKLEVVRCRQAERYDGKNNLEALSS